MHDDMTMRSPQEQEVFQRVWQRVMAGRDGEQCPIEPTPAPMPLPTPAEDRWVDGDVSCAYLNTLGTALPAETDLPESDMTLPPDSAHQRACSAQLRQQTLEALEAWQFYRYLTRRARGASARILTALATDQHRLARKLATAYFLHSGVRYWPSEQLSPPAVSSFWGALRQRHQAEQQTELNYRMAAGEAEDPTLPELYEELMAGCREHCRQLRTLLEQNCP